MVEIETTSISQNMPFAIFENEIATPFGLAMTVILGMRIYDTRHWNPTPVLKRIRWAYLPNGFLCNFIQIQYLINSPQMLFPS